MPFPFGFLKCWKTPSFGTDTGGRGGCFGGPGLTTRFLTDNRFRFLTDDFALLTAFVAIISPFCDSPCHVDHHWLAHRRRRWNVKVRPQLEVLGIPTGGNRKAEEALAFAIHQSRFD